MLTSWREKDYSRRHMLTTFRHQALDLHQRPQMNFRIDSAQQSAKCVAVEQQDIVRAANQISRVSPGCEKSKGGFLGRAKYETLYQ